MLSLPEIATQRVDKLLAQADKNNAKTLVVVGNKNVGKSTLLHSLLEKTDTPRVTLVLEYYFGRKSNQKHGIEKNICHIWEYGGKLEALRTVLPSIPIKGDYYYCIMVDLSKIKRIWETIEICIEAMKENMSSAEKEPEILIIGGKYDLFKMYDNDIKKFICTSLRSLALIHDAHLLFHSSKEVPLSKRAKEVLQSLGFGYEVVYKEKNSNFMKPLVIPKGSDSWENIGIQETSIEQLKRRHLSRIPPEAMVVEASDDTPLRAIQAHPEPTLDKLAALKYEELRNLETLDIAIGDYLLTLNERYTKKLYF